MITRIYIAIYLFLLNGVILLAQNPGDPGGGSDPDVPIDGGAGLLLAAGIAYGTKKVHDRKKQKGKINP